MTLPIPSKNRGFLQSQLLVEELVRQGVDTFFIAPGSRSAPLVAAVAANRRARSIVHFDERGSAFAALGFARAAGCAAAWITTSGSAVANGYPAVVEAYADNIPILLITADRPPELRGTGANQTIDQVRFFGKYVRFYHELSLFTEGGPLSTPIRVAAQAVAAMQHSGGPAHINCQLREPLIPSRGGIAATELSLPDVGEMEEWFVSGHPLVTDAIPGPGSVDQSVLDRLEDAIGRAARGLVVVGALSDARQIAAASDLGNTLGWPVLVDPMSQLRRVDSRLRNQINYYDQLLSCPGSKTIMDPDVIVHIGGRLVSKRLTALINSADMAEYFQLGAPYEFNPGERSCVRVRGDWSNLAEARNGDAGRVRGWTDRWRKLDEQIAAEFEGRGTLRGEPAIARDVLAAVPDTWSLFVGNSMPIRDVDRFGLVGSTAPIFANRGASGIDGNIATAAGLVAGGRRPVLVLIGDLALLHDLNSLALAARLEFPLLIVVVNNDGGGIFSFLPVARFEDMFERNFGTPHGLVFEHAARQFGLDYECRTDCLTLGTSIQDVERTGVSRIVEVRSSRSDNVVIHREITSRISERLSEQLAE